MTGIEEAVILNVCPEQNTLKKFKLGSQFTSLGEDAAGPHDLPRCIELLGEFDTMNCK